MKRTRVAAASFMLALTGISAIGCSDEFTMSSRHGGSVGNSGEVGLRLTVGEALVTSVDYVISNGMNTYRGTIDVSDASTLLAVIGGIEAGTGYTLTLQATASGGVPCTGVSTPFTVVSNATIIVGVTLACRPANNSGSVKIEGTVASCATFAAVSAAAPVNNQIQISVETLPAAPNPPVAIAWNIVQGSGTLSNSTGANPVYTCGQFDEQHVFLDATLTQPGALACTNTFHLIIDCPPPDAPTPAGDGG